MSRLFSSVALPSLLLPASQRLFSFPFSSPNASRGEVSNSCGKGLLSVPYVPDTVPGSGGNKRPQPFPRGADVPGERQTVNAVFGQ